MKVKIWNIFGIILGAILLVAAILGIFTCPYYGSYGRYVEDASFGADFYTYLYKATKAAAENAEAAASNLSTIGRQLHVFECVALAAAGLLIIFSNARQLAKFSLEYKKVSMKAAPQPPFAAPQPPFAAPQPPVNQPAYAAPQPPAYMAPRQTAGPAPVKNTFTPEAENGENR